MKVYKWSVMFEIEMQKDNLEREFWFNNSADAVTFFEWCTKEHNISVLQNPTYKLYDSRFVFTDLPLAIISAGSK